jgi:N-acetylglucosaminyldiphosphoundecaprenol N-acetyl-beta-D-mannosaminyltransferase
MKYTRHDLYGMPIDLGLTPSGVTRALADQEVLLSYLNPLAWQVARHTPDYVENLSAMDLVTCDGIMIQRALNSEFQRREAILSLDYSGIAPQYLDAWSAKGLRLCLVGARPGIAHRAADRIGREFPGIRMSGMYSGFDDDPERAQKHILDNAVDVVLCAMGMGLQERFLVHLRKAGWRGAGIGVGAFFDRLANPGIDYPEWSRKYGVRFLGNLSRRPGYYLRRYAVDYLPFMKQYVLHAARRPFRRN